jgi:hypothetical protein
MTTRIRHALPPVSLDLALRELGSGAISKSSEHAGDRRRYSVVSPRRSNPFSIVNPATDAESASVAGFAAPLARCR